ncbi:DUF1707 domain-containing protein [Thalassotalea euphylliae]|uniref:DUF1707 domain-containing protein n=1 Tax=Thalassotalea euphylliae TaxID=1655234 RepID=UPI0036262F2C
MPVVIEDRPTQAVRDEVIDQLIMNYSHGRLSYDAFERRLDKAMNSEDNVEIAALAEDLELEVDEQYVDSKKRDFSFSFEPEGGEETDTLVNVFSGSSRGGAWKVAKEIRMFSLFSGSDIDFSQARFTHPETHVKVFSLFSGDNIYIPENVNVVSKAFCIFGGIDIKAPNMGQVGAPTIVVEGVAIFSGLDIKVRQSLKEKFIGFADSLKNIFN